MKRVIGMLMVLVMVLACIGIGVGEQSKVLAKKVTPEENKITLAPGTTWQIKLVFTPEDVTDKSIEWKSSNEKVATVDENGVVTGIKKGTCKINISALDGSKRKAAVTVNVKDYEIVLKYPVVTPVYFDTTDDYAEYEVGAFGWGRRTVVMRTVTFKGGVVEGAGDHKLRPLKAGEGTIEVLAKENNKVTEKSKHTVYVAQTAIRENPAPDVEDLALNKPTEASSDVPAFWRYYANDGDLGSYWESQGYPCELTINLERVATVSSIVIRLNPDPVWATRTQKIEVYARKEGEEFKKVLDEAEYKFDPKTGNRISIVFNPVPAQYIKLSYTGGSGWGNAQAAEIMVNGR